MASNRRKSPTPGENRTRNNVWFLITVAVLIVLLLVMYLHNRNRRADFEKLKQQAAGNEIVMELEPRTLEESGEESGEAVESGDVSTDSAS